MRTVFVTAFALLPSLLFAQPSRYFGEDPAVSTLLPPTSVALADEAPSVLVNPAALSQVRALELYYLHSRSGPLAERANALHLADRFGGFLGLGVGIEWVRPGAGGLYPSRRRTTWGLSLGDERFSLGASWGVFGGTSNAFLDRANTFDVGVLSRPSRWLSLGFAVRNLNDPRESLAEGETRAPLHLPRTWALGVGVRPLGERLTVGAEYQVQGRDGWGDGQLSWLLQAEVFRGVRLGAGYAHGLGGSAAGNALQLSLGLDVEHLGVTYAHLFGDARDSGVVQVRASGTAWRSVARPSGRMALVDLAQVLSGTGGTLALLGVREADGFTRLTRLLARAQRDPSLAGVVIKVEALPDMGLGRAEELRQALVSLRNAGKRVVAVMLTGGDGEYLVASAADHVLLVPQSTLMVNGIAANVTFFGGTMEKLGVQWDVAKVGAYKNAPDQLTRGEMTDAHRESLNAWLDVEYQHLVNTLAAARGLDAAQVKAAMDEGMVTPRRAQELGLVDGIINPSELERWLRDNVDGATLTASWAPFGPARGEWGARKRVVVIPVIGTIASGKSREDGFGFAQVAGAQTVVRALEQAAEDSDVAAIVVRVDSGGGDALASDLMYRAVLEAKKKKPIVATMGDVAASGGYYAAMGANEVWAAPTTLTGSIGVFFMKPAAGGLAEKLGITHETLRRGELSNMLSGFDPWTEAEQTAAQKWVDAFYDDFITEVAASRSMTKDQVDQVAQGRVWAGATAKELGLVDHLGSFADALHAARRLGGIGEAEDFEVEIAGEPGGVVPRLGRLEARLEAKVVTSLDPALQAALRELGVAPSVLFQPGLKAMLPFGVRAR